MSSKSQGFYHSPRGARDRSQSPNLPRIRDIVGDVLSQPARPIAGSSEVQHPSRPTHTPHVQADMNTRGLRLPPIQPPIPTNPPRSSSHTSPERSYQTHPSPFHPSSPSQDRRNPAAGEATTRHSYNIFASTSGQGLVHKLTSKRHDFDSHQVVKDDAISTSTGRHVCPECWRRFEKLSTFKNHMTTHTGEKPHECPDCGRSFSVASNMRRHRQIHRSGEAGNKAR